MNNILQGWSPSFTLLIDMKDKSLLLLWSDCSLLRVLDRAELILSLVPPRQCGSLNTIFFSYLSI